MDGFQSNGRYSVTVMVSSQRRWKEKLQHHVNDGNLTITSLTAHDHVDVIELSNIGFLTLFPAKRMKGTQLRSVVEEGSIVDFFNNHPSSAEKYRADLCDDRTKILFKACYKGKRLMSSICLLHGLGIRKWHTNLKPHSPSLLVAFVDVLFRCPYKLLTDTSLHTYFTTIAPSYMVTFEWVDHFAQRLFSGKVNSEDLLSTERMKCAIIFQLMQEESKGHTWSSWTHIAPHVAQTLRRVTDNIEELHQRFSASTTNEKRLVSFTMVKGDTIVPDHYQRIETKRDEDYLLDQIRAVNSGVVNMIDDNIFEAVLTTIYRTTADRDTLQVAAIRNAVQYRISIVSGPPGSGKTSCVIRGIALYFQLKYSDRQRHLVQQRHDRDQTDTMRYQLAKKALSSTYERSDIMGEDSADDGDGFDAVLKRKYQRLRKQYQRAPTSADVSLVKLTAPSGVAARRLSAACDDRAAHTCHAFVGQLSRDQSEEQRKNDGKIDRDFFEFNMWVVDESSMIDLPMFTNIIRTAAKENVALVFVGDANQLPPIGCGQVFQDLIDFQRLPSITLETIYRQGSGSNIAKLSKAIMQPDKTDTLPQILTHKYDDLTVTCMPTDADSKRWNDAVIEEWHRLRAADKNARIQVITPMNEGAGGRMSLNSAIQASTVFTMTDFILRFDNRAYYANDPVIHLKNDYQIDRRNGDIGRVLHLDMMNDIWSEMMENIETATIDKTKIVFVQYGHDQPQPYMRSPESANKKLSVDAGFAFAALKDLDLAFAITAHKSQGSEYEHVIMALPRQGPRGFLCDKLINTMVSRARKTLHIMAPPQIWSSGCAARYENRRTKLNHPHLFE